MFSLCSIALKVYRTFKNVQHSLELGKIFEEYTQRYLLELYSFQTDLENSCNNLRVISDQPGHRNKHRRLEKKI